MNRTRFRWRRVAALAVACAAFVSVGTVSARVFDGPVVTVPGDMTVEASSPGGATVDFSASAVDDMGAPLDVSCNPSPGATFPLGSTTVSCSATDGDGNTGTGSFTVTVVDTTPPSLSPPDVTAEATGPSGATVDYAPVIAHDSVTGDIPATCVPSGGSLFALGATPVACTATDGAGNSATASFRVTVADTTPPTLVLHGDITVYAPTNGGVAASDPAIAAFLGGARATDSVDPAPTISNDAPGVFPSGTTVVTFSARDASGNVAQATASVRIVPPSSSPPPPPPPPADGSGTGSLAAAPAAPQAAPDRTPPAEVTSLVASARSNIVTLQWAPSPARDFDHFLVTRERAGAAVLTIYSGGAPTVADKSVKNGLSYRYLVRVCDRAGNCSSGVSIVAQPHAISLLRPADTAKVTAPPLLVWRPAARAHYYNVQLFRDGKKVLSIWPGTHQLQLARTWTYQHKVFRFGTGRYTWYVWPGMGAHRDRHYGPLLGTSRFTAIG